VKSEIRRLLKPSNSTAVATFYDDVVPCGAAEEIELVSVRFAATLDATVASRLYQVGFGERDGSNAAETFQACQLNVLTANQIATIQFVQGIESQQVQASTLEVFTQVQLPRVRFRAPIRVRVIAYGGQAGDVAGPIDVRWLVRPIE